MKALNFGIIGLGYWGPNYAKVLNDLEGANLSWCCDINDQALAKLKRIYPAVRTSNNINDLLTDKDLNAVIVVTPAQGHFEIVKQFILAGKDVLVEKPLTNDQKTSEELVRLGRNKKRVLMVDHTFVYNLAIRKLKELIDKGKLGDIYYLYGVYNALGPIRKDVSAMWDLPHFIYVANYLLGSGPETITAIGRDYLQKGMEDVVFLTFEYPKDILFNLHCSWIDPVKVRRLVVVGTKKMVVFDDMQPEEKLKIYDKGADLSGDPNFAKLEVVIRTGDVYIPKIENKEPLREVVLAFMESVKTRKPPVSDGQEGLNLVRCLTAAQESLKKHGEKIWLKKV